jgi:hypothetical protein
LTTSSYFGNISLVRTTPRSHEASPDTRS